MNCLLDTHTLLWYLYADRKLSAAAQQAISSAEHVLVSIASLWEIAIKQSKNRLEIENPPAEIAQVCREKRIEILDITIEYLEDIRTMPVIHADPFDRMLIAQARCEGLTLITKDSKITDYDVETLW